MSTREQNNAAAAAQQQPQPTGVRVCVCACACGSYVGDIVVSVNPFKNVGCVGKAIRNRYKKGGAQNAQLLMPHCYHLVDQTYAQVRG